MFFQSRREFIKKAGATAALCSFAPAFAFGEQSKDIGLQLYTLRTEIDKDPLAVLKEVAGIGFKFIEIYPSKQGHFFGYTTKEFKNICDGLGLIPVSMHILTGRSQPEVKGTFVNDWPRLAEEAASVNLKYIVCPWLHQNEYSSVDECLKTAAFLNKIGEDCQKFGLQFAYHNHDFEFKPVEGKVPYELFLTNTDSNMVKFEMDLYWVVKGGENPVNLFLKNPGRFALWHVKDMDKLNKDLNADVGTGSINFKEIFENKNVAGMKYFFLEQETYRSSSLNSVKNGYRYLKNLNY